MDRVREGGYLGQKDIAEPRRIVGRFPEGELRVHRTQPRRVRQPVIHTRGTGKLRQTNLPGE